MGWSIAARTCPLAGMRGASWPGALGRARADQPWGRDFMRLWRPAGCRDGAGVSHGLQGSGGTSPSVAQTGRMRPSLLMRPIMTGL